MENPSLEPTLEPSKSPTLLPTAIPSVRPTAMPSTYPTLLSSTQPSFDPIRFALERLYNYTDGPNWEPKQWDFSSGDHYCEFDGITCDGSDLQEISLSDNRLQGPLPSEIGLLLSLTYLYLDINSITGTIPSEIGLLSSLERLILDGNSITGTLPTELCLANIFIDYDGDEISCTCIDTTYTGTTCSEGMG